MVRLIANRSMSYNTRRLQAGEAFEASDRDAKILTGLRRAEVATGKGRATAPGQARKAPRQSGPPVTTPEDPEPTGTPPPPPESPTPPPPVEETSTGGAPTIETPPPAGETEITVDPLIELRAEAERLGIGVDGRWGVARLQTEIEEARAAAS